MHSRKFPRHQAYLLGRTTRVLFESTKSLASRKLGGGGYVDRFGNWARPVNEREEYKLGKFQQKVSMSGGPQRPLSFFCFSSGREKHRKSDQTRFRARGHFSSSFRN